MRILTCSEAREVAGAPGNDARSLIERAGYAVAQFCASQFKFGSACVVCGRGNNGAVGLVAAAALKRIAEPVKAIILGKESSELGAAAKTCLGPEIQPLWVFSEADFDSDAVRDALGADLVIDAVIGTGFRPPLRPLARKAIEAINDASGTVVSVDLPSGVDGDSMSAADESGGEMVFAQAIIALIAPKPAHVFGELTTGAVSINEIGAQPILIGYQTGLEVVTGREVSIAFPSRARDVSKEDFGRILVIGGSAGKGGAAALAGLAALSSGAGSVTVACPQSIQAAVGGFNPALVTYGLSEVDGAISAAASETVSSLLADNDVAVIGPGLSLNPESQAFVRHLVAHCPLPLIIDGDGLAAFEGHYEELKRRGAAASLRVLACEARQAARLTSTSLSDIEADTVASARRIAKETGANVVLRGRRTAVAGASGETWINMTGNAALAKEGSSDVLAGIIAASLARRLSGPNNDSEQPNIEGNQARRNLGYLSDLRVAAAVYLHGLAGDIARDALHENTVLATDLIEGLSGAFRECELQVERSLYFLRK